MNWFYSNIVDRLTNKNLDFSLKFSKIDFDIVSFDTASNNVVLDIVNSTSKKIYVLLSGGLDSEFVIRKFHQLKIDFIPVIIDREGEEYRLEREYAYKVLRDLNITNAKILKLSDVECVKIVYEKIYKNLNSNIFAPIQIYSCQFAESENAIIVDGTHFGGFAQQAARYSNRLMEEKYKEQNWNNSLMKNCDFFLRESEIYALAYYKIGFPLYCFFMHTPQIVVSMLDEIDDKDYHWHDYKSRIYKISYRPKLRSKLPELDKNIVDLIKINNPDFFQPRGLSNENLLNKKYPKDTVNFGKKEQFRSLIINGSDE